MNTDGCWREFNLRQGRDSLASCGKGKTAPAKAPIQVCCNRNSVPRLPLTFDTRCHLQGKEPPARNQQREEEAGTEQRLLAHFHIICIPAGFENRQSLLLP
uniref:Uncharacterized protein n=1 Tax=Micrurus lemniscatus lemniscatus TaxID=129467 RepID=A0A2D4HF33_MICLE